MKLRPRERYANWVVTKPSATSRAAAFVVLISVAFGANAQSERHPSLASNWWLDAGFYYPDRKFSASLNGTVSGENEDIDFSGDFGLDDQKGIFNGELGWQFSQNWGASVQYFSSSRSENTTIDEEIEWEDVVYEVGADITASTSLDITRIVAFRRFRESGGHDFRIVAGLHWLDISASLSGQARLDDDTSDFVTRRAAASAPLPNIGAWYRYSPSERWVFSARVDWLEASIDKYNGRIINATGGVNYGFNEHLGLGLKYQYFSLSAGVDNDTWNGDVSIKYQGPFIFLSGYW